MNERVEAPPFRRDPLEHRFRLPRLRDVQWHDDLRFELFRQRGDELLGLLVEVGHCELGAERAQPFCAAPGDRLLVGDADDQGLASLKLRANALNRHAILASSIRRALDRAASVWRAIISSSSVGTT